MFMMSDIAEVKKENGGSSGQSPMLENNGESHMRSNSAGSLLIETTEECVTEECHYQKLCFVEEGEGVQAAEGKEETQKQEKDAKATASQASNQKSHDTSENNSYCCTAIPCCRGRKCVCARDCQGCMEMKCLDPCCCNPCIPTPFVENVQLKEENKALRRCIKRVRQSAVSEACDIIKTVVCGCNKCCCCTARTRLRPCKSSHGLGRDTCLCVPLPGSNSCGGYTPSGWSRLLKKCTDISCDDCGFCKCDFTQGATPVRNRRKKCLAMPKPCPPCPHLCIARSLPRRIRPYTPCCPLYFPNSVCCSKSFAPSACGSCGSDKSCHSFKSAASIPSCCKGITPPPYTPMYMPQTSASVPQDGLKGSPHGSRNGQSAGGSPHMVESPTRVSQSR